MITITIAHGIPLIMIDPAGDNNSPGRTIDNDFEAGLTLQCAHTIKTAIDPTVAQIQITRNAGKAAMPFIERCSFANRLRSNLYVSISFFKSNEPVIMIYYYCAHPVMDFWQFPYSTLSFIPYDQIHRQYLRTSIQLSQEAQRYLQKQTHVNIRGPFGIPIKELHGFTSPAIKCEIGLTHSDQWRVYAPTLASMLTQLLQPS